MITVHCHGTVDLLHYGHILLFQMARAMGDRLVVTLTADEFVAKGPGRPVFNENQRLAWVKELRSVDEAFICRERTGVAAINMVRPQIYAKGRDTVQWTEVIAEEQAAVEACGGNLVYIDTGTVFHSGELLSGKYLRNDAERKDWISVKDHLPSREKNCVCAFNTGYVVILKIGPNILGNPYFGNLTHWMEIPNTPSNSK